MKRTPTLSKQKIDRVAVIYIKKTVPVYNTWKWPLWKRRCKTTFLRNPQS